jgi:hypothetical protein
MVEPMPNGNRVIDANGIVLAHVYGQPNGAISVSDRRLTNDEARRISKLIARLPERSHIYFAAPTMFAHEMLSLGSVCKLLGV